MDSLNERPPREWGGECVTVEDVRAIRQFLTEHGTFQFPSLPNGLFAAAAGEGDDFESTGYRNIWLRDNIHIAWAHWFVSGDPAKAVDCVHSLLTFYSRHLSRFTDIIEGRKSADDPMDRPHIRFNGETLTELPEKWSHAQNDALGYLLWLSCRLASAGHLEITADFAAVLSGLVRYWQTIEVWQDEDSGHWEEARKIEASSIGVVVAGLRSLLNLFDNPTSAGLLEAGPAGVTREAVTSLLQTTSAELDRILPAECIQSDPRKARPVDAALLFLVWPLQVVSRPVAEQIVSNVKQALQGHIGIRRYNGDSYWCADYKQLLKADERTTDFSDNMDARDRLLQPGMEAQWCIFDPILSCIFGQWVTDADSTGQVSVAQARQLQREHLQRSLAQLTDGTGRFPAYRCPESWYCENGVWGPNDITPLLWTQGNLWQALNIMEQTALLSEAAGE
ncbi:MAG: phosphorylase kinase [Planctomycetaceae bacterium]|nr:phosphorylase kinase [Planctomycetaceae bacterium]